VILTAVLICLAAAPAPDAGASDAAFVSTVGSKLYLAGSARLRGFTLIRIENRTDARNAIQFLTEIAAGSDAKHRALLSLLLRQIDVRNYDAEKCFLLMSPRTHDLFISEPYRTGGNGDIIFDVEITARREEEGYSFVRVLVLPRNASDPRILVRTQEGDVRPSAYQGAP
jgi:hypothetical protein